MSDSDELIVKYRAVLPVLTKLVTTYGELEVLLEEYRVEWEATKKDAGRRENYWQGKKDGLRTSMNLIAPLVLKVRDELDIGDGDDTIQSP